MAYSNCVLKSFNVYLKKNTNDRTHYIYLNDSLRTIPGRIKFIKLNVMMMMM